MELRRIIHVGPGCSISGGCNEKDDFGWSRCTCMSQCSGPSCQRFPECDAKLARARPGGQFSDFGQRRSRTPLWMGTWPRASLRLASPASPSPLGLASSTPSMGASPSPPPQTSPSPTLVVISKSQRSPVGRPLFCRCEATNDSSLNGSCTAGREAYCTLDDGDLTLALAKAYENHS